MESKICLDTDILIDFLRNKKEAVEFIELKENKSELATTFINLFELYCGAYKSKNQAKSLQAVELLCERITLLNLTKEAVKKAGEIYSDLSEKGKLIEFRDLLVGSVAITKGYSIKTNNIKHFEKMRELVLESNSLKPVL